MHNITKWMANIKTVFRKSDLGEVLNDRFVTCYDSKYVLSTVKSMLISEYMSRWESDFYIVNIHS